MSDREMLELAAKAAGIDAHWGDGWQSNTMFRSLPRPNSPLVTNVEWNPLTDDGDALRLAVRLNMTVGEHLGARHAGPPPCPDDYEDGGYPVRIAQMDNDDPYAATRRAIVRAAAEIGRKML